MRNGVDRRTVLAGVAAAGTVLAWRELPSSAPGVNLTSLDLLQERLELFRTLRREELARLWQARKQPSLSECETAARAWADKHSGLAATANLILDSEPATPEQDAFIERASDALVEYAMPCSDWDVIALGKRSQKIRLPLSAQPDESRLFGGYCNDVVIGYRGGYPIRTG